MSFRNEHSYADRAHADSVLVPTVAADAVLQANVCRRIDEVIVRIQTYMHRLPWDPPYSGTYASVSDALDDANAVLGEAIQAGMPQNDHKRSSLGVWIGMLGGLLEDGVTTPVWQDEEEGSIAKIQ